MNWPNLLNRSGAARAGLILSLWILSLGSGEASPESTTIHLDKELQINKWFLDAKKTPVWSQDKRVAVLQKMRHAELNKKWDSCLRRVAEARQLLPAEVGWLSVQELRCRQSQAKENKQKIKALEDFLQRLERDERVWAGGTHVTALRSELFTSRMWRIADEAARDRRRAWQNLEPLMKRLSFWGRSERADLLRWAGQLAGEEKNWPAAVSYFERSLQELDNADVRKSWLNAISLISGEKPPPSLARINGEVGALLLVNPIADNGFSAQGVSHEEGALLESLRQALQSQQTLAAVKAGIRHLQKFPTGGRASWSSSQISELLVKGLREGTFSKEDLDSMAADLANLPADFLTSWMKSFYFANLYGQALGLCRAAMEDSARYPQLGEFAYWCGRSASNVDEMAKAIDYLRLAQIYRADTSVGREATLHLGLVYYRQKEWKSASSQFQQLTMLQQSEEEVDLLARYWLWRSLQKLELKEQGERTARELMQRYPLTYYGVRARWEMGEFSTAWLGREPGAQKMGLQKTGLQKTGAQKTNSRRVKIWLSQAERQIWNRCHLYLQAGWLEAATAEWELLKSFGGRDGRLFSVAVEETLLRYPKAMSLAGKVLDEDLSEWRTYLLSVLFPREYRELVAESSQRYDLDPYLVHALIKQESAYDPRAKSSAQALGLMQLIPPTAREVAENLRIENLLLPDDLYDQKTNIQFGTHYLSRMLRLAGGHVPIALAAYNAGPGRVTRWLNARPGLSGLREKRSSLADDEIWIEELPWAETRNYVRRILRNIIMYRAMYGQEVVLSEPIWDAGKK